MTENSQEGESVSREPVDVTIPFPEDFAQQLKMVIVSPAAFFKAMPAGGSYVQPAVFLAITSAVHAVSSAIIHGHPLSVFMDFFGGFSLFVFIAGVLFGLSKVFGGDGNFRGAFSVTAYASAPKVITWVPLGGWLFGLYSLYLLVLGLRAQQKLSTKKAITVVAIPTVVLFLFSVVISILARMIPGIHR